jgi:hypothetical protein
MTQLGGTQGPVTVAEVVDITELVTAVDVCIVVTVTWMTSDIDVEAVSPPPVPVIGIVVVVEGAAFEIPMENVERTVPPIVGVTGLGLNPPATSAGNEAERVTGELKVPLDMTVTVAVAVPPGLRIRLLGLTERLNRPGAVTVNVPVADFPVLPKAMIM